MSTHRNYHDFRECLEWSAIQSDEPFWDQVYRKAFPDMVGWINTASAGNSPIQEHGIDRIIVLKSDRHLYIDEKKSSRSYNSFFLEYISNDRIQSPGWMEKPLRIDFLAYAFMPDQRVYLLQWDMLQRAWRNFRREWLSTYPTRKVPNKTYHTWGVCVPISVVRAAISRAGIIDVQLDALDVSDEPPQPTIFQRPLPPISCEQGSLFDDCVA